MTQAHKKIFKIIAGVLLIIIGILALVTPFTPGSWLAFVGLELLGVRIAFWDKLKGYIFQKKEDNDTRESKQ